MGKLITYPIVNQKRVTQFAELAKTLPIEKPLNFYSFRGKDGGEIIAEEDYPPLHAPWAIDFFFFACIHQYGFWHGEKKYEGPLLGTLNGKRVKGSDLLHKLLLRAVTRNEKVLTPAYLAHMLLSDYCRMFSDDNGPISLFISDERYELTLSYAKWFLEHNVTPGGVLQLTNTYYPPVGTLLNILGNIPGYREDPLRKKAMLLLMSLANRPEHFVVPEKNFAWDPIVDYHLMRLTLRLGLVTIPKDWVSENSERKFTSSEREGAIRKAVFHAVQSLIKQSGRSMAEIDNLMWSARHFCPETVKPDCKACMLQKVCAKKIALFQPVIRTTAY